MIFRLLIILFLSTLWACQPIEDAVESITNTKVDSGNGGPYEGMRVHAPLMAQAGSSFEVSASGGTPPYQFFVSGEAQIVESFERKAIIKVSEQALDQSSLKIQVLDQNDLKAEAHVTIIETPTLLNREDYPEKFELSTKGLVLSQNHLYISATTTGTLFEDELLLPDSGLDLKVVKSTKRISRFHFYKKSSQGWELKQTLFRTSKPADPNYQSTYVFNDYYTPLYMPEFHLSNYTGDFSPTAFSAHNDEVVFRIIDGLRLFRASPVTEQLEAVQDLNIEIPLDYGLSRELETVSLFNGFLIFANSNYLENTAELLVYKRNDRGQYLKIRTLSLETAIDLVRTNGRHIFLLARNQLIAIDMDQNYSKQVIDIDGFHLSFYDKNSLAVAANSDDIAYGTHTYHIHFYKLVNQLWQKEDTVIDDRFLLGNISYINPNKLAVGAYLKDMRATRQTGAILIYEKSHISPEWQVSQEIQFPRDKNIAQEYTTNGPTYYFGSLFEVDNGELIAPNASRGTSEFRLFDID